LFFYVNVICMAEQAGKNELTATTTGAATTGREIH
jgi:hypothetical protein